MTEWPSTPRLCARSAASRSGDCSARHGLSHAELQLVDHHEAHAAAAAWAAGRRTAARSLTIDGVGDGVSSTISTFRDGRLRRVAASPRALLRSACSSST